MPPRSKCFLLVLIALGAAAGRADEPKPAWQALPRDWPTRLIIADPLPHLRRVLSSETLRKTLTQGKLARFLKDSQQRLTTSDGRPKSGLAEWVSGMGDVPEKLDPQNWLSAIEARQSLIPAEIVLAAPDTAGSAIGDLFHAVMLSQLTPAAVRLDDGASELQDAAIQLLRRAKLPRLTVRVRFRDPALPNLAFAQAKALARQLVPADWNATIEDRALGIKQRLGAVYQEDDIQSMIVALGLAAEGDEKLAAMSKAAAALEFELWLESADNDLVLTLGERLQNEKPTEEDLGPLWPDDAGRILFATWRFAGFKKRIRESVALLERYADSPVGKAAAEADENDFSGTLRRMDERLGRAADSGSASLTLDNSLALRTITQGAAPAPPLSGSPLLKLIPAEIEQLSLSTADSFDRSLATMLDNFEDRMETRSLQYDLTGKNEMAAQLANVKGYYYAQMQDVRRLVFDKAEKVFEPPLASLFGASGQIDRLQVRLRSAEGLLQSIELRDVPCPEYAVIAAARETDAAVQFLAEMIERLRSHVRGAPAAAGEKFKPRRLDVGLGVPTFGFGPLGSTLSDSDADQASWRVEAKGDVLPHYFAHERFVIVSTSVRLSKAILAAGRGEANRLSPPRPDSGELIAYGRCPADLFARLIEQVAAWSAALADEKKTTIEGELFESFRPTVESSQSLSRFLAGLAEIVRLVDRAEWQTSQSAQGRTSQMTILPRE